MDSYTQENYSHCREEEIYEPRKRIDENLRVQALKIMKDQMNVTSNQMIALRLGVTARRVSSMKKEFLQSGDIRVTDKHFRSRKNGKKVSTQNAIIQQSIQKNKFISAKEIHSRLKENGHVMCLSSLFNRLNEIGYKYKKDVYVPEIRNNSKIIDERCAFSAWISQMPDENLFYSGEGRFDLNMGYLYGWTHKDSEVNQLATEFISAKHQFLTAYIAIGCNGIVGWKIANQREHSSLFIEHLNESYASLASEQDFLLLESSQTHCSHLANEYMETHDINFKYIPLYTPCFNPIWTLMNLIKTKVCKKIEKGKIETIEKLHQQLDRVITKFQDLSLVDLYNEMRYSCERANYRQKL